MTVPQRAPEPCAEPPSPADRERRPARLHVTVHAIPDPDPPYDDEVADPPDAASAPRARTAPQGALPALRRPPLPPCPVLPAAAALRLVPPDELLDEDPEESFDPVRTPRGELEDPVPRAAMLTRALLEAMAGIRPVTQLSKWVTAEVLAVMQASVVHRNASRPAPTALRRVLVSEPLPGVAEVTAIVDRGNRAEALALRLEGLDGRWVVTALQRA